MNVFLITDFFMFVGYIRKTSSEVDIIKIKCYHKSHYQPSIFLTVVELFVVVRKEGRRVEVKVDTAESVRVEKNMDRTHRHNSFGFNLVREIKRCLFFLFFFFSL